MASQATMAAVDARLADKWVLCPVLAENMQGETPSDGSPFVIVQYPVNTVDRMTVSNRRYREIGTVRFVIHTEIGEGKAKGALWGEQLAAMFRHKIFGGIRTQVPSSPTEGEGDGNYHVTSLSCPFTRDFFDTGGFYD